MPQQLIGIIGGAGAVVAFTLLTILGSELIFRRLKRYYYERKD